MIYLYHCEKCNADVDVWKSVAEFERAEPCPTCGLEMNRKICAPRGFINASVENAEYNPGLGCVVKNRNHRQEICKQRNLIEVGNEKPATIHSEADRTLADKLRSA